MRQDVSLEVNDKTYDSSGGGVSLSADRKKFIANDDRTDDAESTVRWLMSIKARLMRSTGVRT